MEESEKKCSSCVCQALKTLDKGSIVMLFLEKGNILLTLDKVKGNCIKGTTIGHLTTVINCQHVIGFSIVSEPPTPPGLIEQETFEFEGEIVTTMVPDGATTVTIRAIGAAGGDGNSENGIGALIQGDFPVTPGETLSVLVGQQGETGATIYGENGGGGGGSFVWRGDELVTPFNLLVAAGGGGGGCTVSENPGLNASLTTNGTDGNPGASGGTSGQGGFTDGFAGGGGAGILPSPYGDGKSSIGKGGQSIHDGGAGGTGDHGNDGGFGGGGGGAFAEGGGGGGFSGGAGGGIDDLIGGGGGGGSQNNGSNQVNLAGIGTGDGQVTLSFFQ